MRKARVFISCGQLNSKETQIGKSIEDYFISRKFKTYFAERVHSSEGLTENIFKFLRQSEYFVFIDFKRGRINENEFRGSLFVNQEIAIATFLRLNAIGFFENGIKREGILNYHIYNAFPFTDEKDIIKKLEEETKHWDINSVNELKIHNPNNTLQGIQRNNLQVVANWYTLEIKNRNKGKHALFCSGYVTRIKDLKNNKECQPPDHELVWTRTGEVVVNIMGGATRNLDAFLAVNIDGVPQIRFNRRRPPDKGPPYLMAAKLLQGKYLIEYTVISSNFENVSQNYILELGGTEQDIKFSEAN